MTWMHLAQFNTVKTLTEVTDICAMPNDWLVTKMSHLPLMI